MFAADDDELAKQIQAGHEKRKEAFANMMADLEAKYAKPDKKRKALENGEGIAKKGKREKATAKGKTGRAEKTTPPPKRVTRSSRK